MTKPVNLSYKQIKELREKQDLSWAKIAEQTGGNPQSVEACYGGGEDRVYRPRPATGKKRGRPRKNGNGHKATNGHKGRPRKNGTHARVLAPNPELQAFTDELVANLRARGIWFLQVDLRQRTASVKFEGEQSFEVRG